MKWNGMKWNGMKWNEMEWNGMEWNGIASSKRSGMEYYARREPRRWRRFCLR